MDLLEWNPNFILEPKIHAYQKNTPSSLHGIKFIGKTKLQRMCAKE